MGEHYLGIKKIPQIDDPLPPAPKKIAVLDQPSSTSRHGLVPCPDCQHKCSSYAEACPACGRFFRAYKRVIEVTPGKGWSVAVGWGVILSSVFAGLIIGAIFVVLFMLIAGMGAAARP